MAPQQLDIYGDIDGIVVAYGGQTVGVFTTWAEAAEMARAVRAQAALIALADAYERFCSAETFARAMLIPAAKQSLRRRRAELIAAATSNGYVAAEDGDVEGYARQRLMTLRPLLRRAA